MTRAAGVPGRTALLVAGPAAPEFHGAAIVTDRFTQRASARHTVVSLPTHGALRLRVTRHLTALAAMVRHRADRPVVYVSVAGSRGQAADLVLVGVARLLGLRRVLHHHSYRYLDRRDRLSAALFAVAGAEAEHVALCPEMADLLRQVYGVRIVHVLDNSAFIPPADTASDDDDRPPTIGHLANLSLNKGLAEVIEVARRLPDARLLVAGPSTSAEATAVLVGATEELGPRLQYLDQVSGTPKDRFFADTDIFVLPTRYVHEAAPLVVLEALAAGATVVTVRRGCLGGWRGAPGLHVVDDPAEAVERVIELLPASGRSARSGGLTDREAVRRGYERRHLDALQDLDQLLAHLTRPIG